MSYTVTKSFVDWDGVQVKKGEIADDCIPRDVQKRSGKRWWNLIKNGRVMSVHLGYPPVKSTT